MNTKMIIIAMIPLATGYYAGVNNFNFFFAAMLFVIGMIIAQAVFFLFSR